VVGATTTGVVVEHAASDNATTTRVETSDTVTFRTVRALHARSVGSGTRRSNRRVLPVQIDVRSPPVPRAHPSVVW
jgi:hypothetical protein